MGMNIHNILSFSPDLSCFLELARFGLVDRMEFNPLLCSQTVSVGFHPGPEKVSSSALGSAFNGGVTIMGNCPNSRRVFRIPFKFFFSLLGSNQEWRPHWMSCQGPHHWYTPMTKSVSRESILRALHLSPLDSCNVVTSGVSPHGFGAVRCEPGLFSSEIAAWRPYFCFQEPEPISLVNDIFGC